MVRYGAVRRNNSFRRLLEEIRLCVPIESWYCGYSVELMGLFEESPAWCDEYVAGGDVDIKV